MQPQKPSVKCNPVKWLPDGKTFLQTLFFFFFLVYVVVGVTLIVVPTGSPTPNLAGSRFMMNFTQSYALWGNGGSCTQASACTSRIVAAAGPMVNGTDLLTAVVFLLVAYYFVAFGLSWKKPTDSSVSWIAKMFQPTGEGALPFAHWPTETVFATVESILLVMTFYFLGMRDVSQALLLSACVFYFYGFSTIVALAFAREEPSDVTSVKPVLTKNINVRSSSIREQVGPYVGLLFMSAPFFFAWSAAFLAVSQAQNAGHSNAPPAALVGVFFIFTTQLLRAVGYVVLTTVLKIPVQSKVCMACNHAAFCLSTLTVVGIFSRDWTAAGATIYV